MHRKSRKSVSGKPPSLVTPKISHLQFLVLFEISRGVRKGKALRQALGEEEVSQKLPTFFAFMTRLQDAGLITRKRIKATGGARGEETAYSLTGAGRKALKEVREFYRRLERKADPK